ncbi:rhodanese-like domain-containing protein [Streptomyces sp. NPDC058316]|uniref:rhodanese-like domain-containing protein n=1 Tax=unclassified Streptomyces TaxID=2593676 RepID=UPI0033276309
MHTPLEELSGRCPELPDDRPLITFRISGIRSASAANLLVENGFYAVDTNWGLADRRAAGKPLTTR